MITHSRRIALLTALLLTLTLLPVAQAAPGVVLRSQIEPVVHVVEAGETLYGIANRYGVTVEAIVAANQIVDPSRIGVGQELRIQPTIEAAQVLPQPAPPTVPTAEASTLRDRMTPTARRIAPNSPYYRTTWVTYYGRPTVDVMGILGEFSIPELIPRLQAQADVYDEANGPDMGVMPAFHLVYGMATRAPGPDGSYLNFLSDEVTLSYIEAAQAAGFSVLLDVQVGALSTVDAMRPAFRWLAYDNVHLALDPEFAIRHPGQTRPGNPIGFVTADEVNAVQRAMRDHMRANGIAGRRILIVHQFMESMIRPVEELARYYKIDLTITADGFGGPWPKIGKYNDFISASTPFAGFKLFYRWDEPLLTERQVLGIDRYPDVSLMEFVPNLIIYQ